MSEESAWVKFRYEMAWLRFKLACEKVMDLETKYSADQPREPAGSSQGGEWTAGGTAPARLRGRIGLPSYKLKDATVIVPDKIRPSIQHIGEDYKLETGETMVVASGTRTPMEQADAMYKKFSAGGSAEVYADQKAADQIKDAYADGVTAEKTPRDIISDMAAVVKTQVDHGVYISRHLVNGTADIRVNRIGSANIKVFQKIAKSYGAKVIPKGIPAHVHLQFPH